MQKNPFKLQMRVRAKVLVEDWRTSRTMKPGDTGEVVMTYPYTVQVRADGKKLTVETNQFQNLEEVK